MDLESIRARVETLIAQGADTGEYEDRVLALFEGTRSLVAAVYGPGSPQMRNLDSIIDLQARTGGLRWGSGPYLHLANAALVNLRDEIKAGLVGNLRLQLTGGVVSDFIALAREHLGAGGDGPKNVAAVLAAAAYEDAIRRLARERCGLLDRIKLDQVLESLRQAGVLTDSQFTIAQGYLKFRNDALHADWEKIERPSVASVLAFTEALILRHFG